MATGDANAEGQRASTDALIGTTVGGRFKVAERIARGGMACVYFATQQSLNRPAAIKVLRADGAEDQESFRRRFLLEASMLAQLQHPNIVTLLDYGQIDTLPGEHYYMAMEFLHGETLSRRLKTRGALPVVDTLRMARQMGRALREAHRRGFVHRDMKPSNVMLVPEDAQNDIVKLVDFGIGKVVTQPNPELSSDEEEVTRVGLMLGSPRHMSPEQIRGEAIEPRTDLYGLGVVLFQMLSGRLPFDGRNDVDILVAHCTRPAPKLIEACPDRFIPQSLSDLVDALLQKRVEDRPTIFEFLQKLADVEDEVFGALGVATPTMSQHPSVPPPMPSPLVPTFGDIPSERPTRPDNPRAREAARSADEASQASSVAPLEAGTRKKRLRVVLGLLLASTVGVVALALTWPRNEAQLTPVLGSPSVAIHLNALEARPEESNFSLGVDSAPRGAKVAEGSTVLGKTPAKPPVSAAASAPALRVRRNVVKPSAITTAVPVKGDDSLEIRTRR